MIGNSASAIRLDDLAARPTTAGGLFVEQPSHRHVAVREASLGRSDWLPQPPDLTVYS